MTVNVSVYKSQMYRHDMCLFLHSFTMTD